MSNDEATTTPATDSDEDLMLPEEQGIQSAKEPIEVDRARLDPDKSDMKWRTEWDGDLDLEKSGVWVDMAGGQFVFLRPMYSPRFTDRYEALLEPKKRLIRRGGARANQMNRKLQQQALAEKSYTRHGVDPLELWDEGEAPGSYGSIAEVKVGSRLGGPFGEFEVVELEDGVRILADCLPIGDGRVVGSDLAARLRMLTNLKFFQDVQEAADAVETFRREDLEADSGN